MKPLVFTPEVTFEDAIKQLNANGNGFLPIVDEAKKLLGIITDGDLRRAILKKEYDILRMMNSRPITVDQNITKAQIRKMLKMLHRRHMPVVDAEGGLVDVVVLDDFDIPEKTNWVVVMAGGLGSRLGELTKEIPKPMLPIAGKPVLERIIATFKEQGFRRFILCLNYKAALIKEYFKDGTPLDVEIRYTEEEQKLGTAGALSLIERQMLNEPFFVINGDVLTKIDYLDFFDDHIKSEAMASMVVKQYEEYIPYACVTFDETTEEMQYVVEKPRHLHYINTGIYILKPACLSYIPKNDFFDMPILFETLLKEKHKIKVYRIDNEWIDIGYPQDYDQANHLYTNR